MITGNMLQAFQKRAQIIKPQVTPFIDPATGAVDGKGGGAAAA